MRRIFGVVIVLLNLSKVSGLSKDNKEAIAIDYELVTCNRNVWNPRSTVLGLGIEVSLFFSITKIKIINAPGFLLQEKAARLPSIEEIRTVLDHSLRGMLSTFSQVMSHALLFSF